MNLILDIDWNAAYLKKRQQHHAPDDKSYWDDRASQYAEHQGNSKSQYVGEFLRLLDIQPGQSVLDVGCGPGNLVIPLAKQGHKVIAADFSPAMLDIVRARATKEKLDDVSTLELDWNGDWAAAGLKPNSVDIAIASRSTIVENMQEALLKLDTVAKDKVAITVVTESGPKHEYKIGEVVDGLPYVPDYIFAMNILFQLGRHPELRYISSTVQPYNSVDTVGATDTAGKVEAPQVIHTPSKQVIWAFITWVPKSCCLNT